MEINRTIYTITSFNMIERVFTHNIIVNIIVNSLSVLSDVT